MRATHVFVYFQQSFLSSVSLMESASEPETGTHPWRPHKPNILSIIRLQ